MKLSHLLVILVGALTCLGPLGISLAQNEKASIAGTEKGMAQQKKVAIARIWHGRTPTAKAEEYYAYLTEAGIRKIQAIPGNLGVQVFRRRTNDVTEFTVISYWESIDAIRKFAGEDIEKTHNLPRDAEFLLELEPTVKHHEVVLNEWKH